MGIVSPSPKTADKTPASNGKRRSLQADFANLKPLNPNGLAGFAKFRDPNESPDTNGTHKSKSDKKRPKDVDSDDEEIEAGKEVLIKTEGDDMQESNCMLSPEDAKHQAELASGVQKIRVDWTDQYMGTRAKLQIAETATLDGSYRFPITCTSTSSITVFEHTDCRLNTASLIARDAVDAAQHCLRRWTRQGVGRSNDW